MLFNVIINVSEFNYLLELRAMGKGITMSVCYVRKVDLKIHVVSASVACSSSYSHFFINTNFVCRFYIRNKLNTIEYFLL